MSTPVCARVATIMKIVILESINSKIMHFEEYKFQKCHFEEYEKNNCGHPDQSRNCSQLTENKLTI